MESSQKTQYQIEFTGNGFEYFKIWIVNIFFTIITLGIYSAWATVRNRRYFASNTLVDNVAFGYHATPLQILKGRVIALVVIILYNLLPQLNLMLGLAFTAIILIAMPWLIVSSARFSRSMLSYRNLRFGFAGTAANFALSVIAPVLLGVLILGATILFASTTMAIYSPENLIPQFAIIALSYIAFLAFSGYLFDNFFIGHSSYGSLAFNHSLKLKQYLKAYALAAGVFAILAAIIGVVFFSGLDGLNTMLSGDPQYFQNPIVFIGFGLLFIALYIAYTIAGVLIRNHAYSATKVGAKVQIQSSLSFGTAFWVTITNSLLLLLSLGLAFPWCKVRKSKMLADATSIQAQDSLDHIMGNKSEANNAFGQELTDGLDVGMDVGIGI